MEDGTIILIGATTENPYFEVNGALLSRSVIFELTRTWKRKISRHCFAVPFRTEKKAWGRTTRKWMMTHWNFWRMWQTGMRVRRLTAIELGILTTERSADGIIHITLEVAQECIQKRVVRYDKSGDNHYDTISAFIKSMRGSDPDAALYYLARMLYAGEDIRFISRTDHDLCGGGCGKWQIRTRLQSRSAAATGSGTHRNAGGTASY